MAPRPRILVSLPVGSWNGGGDPRAQVELAKRVEGVGADGIVLADHVVLGKHVDTYPWGTFPFPSDSPWLEPLTVLTVIVAVTERITLTTGILIVPLRPAALLAKTVATLDVLSADASSSASGPAGRPRSSPPRYSIRPSAGSRSPTTSACAVSVARGPVRPSRRPSPSRTCGRSRRRCAGRSRDPLLGTLTNRNLDRIVRLGDGWIPIMGESADGIGDGVRMLRKALQDAVATPTP